MWEREKAWMENDIGFQYYQYIHNIISPFIDNRVVVFFYFRGNAKLL